MLIVDARESDSLDRALKVFKKKFEKAGVVKELRKRQAFTLPSVKRRTAVLKAVYVQQLRASEE
ncbi:MAG TPA: 30S ribosomal protein S21 [Chitinophagales bacterium]|jgi:small subunit ribosomal protein S21|nr:30S ribosomal protein S21 [Chitinophagales bacterium]HPA37007.1 30S ribosomal protein S21 [Chitinophagales bacterium]HPW87145.1 30S ribosomal protein S21 [Chitinophagales bacterium]HQD12593.1 30S ribosomal protein S21 [Chitinophagales bacterium]HQO31257.1 30S ribosomal protein S21 [Chitinophagales bacterium]